MLPDAPNSRLFLVNHGNPLSPCVLPAYKGWIGMRGGDSITHL